MRYAYLTCELLGRDLDSRLLVAAHLVSRGIACVVGHQWGIFGNLSQCPKGVVLFKTANEVQGRAAADARRAGHKVVMSDEEVLALTSRDEIERITSRAAVESADVFLVMDARHKAVVDAILPGKTQIAGNARVDLLMNHASVYTPEADHARKAGPYILFNTSFGTLNSVWGSPEEALSVAYQTMKDAVGPERAKAIADDILTFERANFGAIKELLAWARATFPQRIVLRPHPAEKADTWTSIANVEVVEKTNPIPWLLGADLMIHASSTTGLEGALLGTPCLSIVAAETQSFSNAYATRDVNHTVTSVDEAKAAITAFIRDKSGPIAAQPKPPFAGGGAEKTAAAIAALATDAAELRAWGHHDSKPRQIEKVHSSAEDFAGRTKRIFDSAKVKSVKIGQLDRSVFLLVA